MSSLRQSSNNFNNNNNEGDQVISNSSQFKITESYYGSPNSHMKKSEFNVNSLGENKQFVYNKENVNYNTQSP